MCDDFPVTSLHFSPFRLTAIALVLMASSFRPLHADSSADAPSITANLGTGVTSALFGKTPEGDVVTLYTLTNKKGMSISIMDYGATIVKIMAPDKNGKLDDVVLGFDSFEPYLHVTTYFGATIGRYANRIAGGTFTMGKTTYTIPHKGAAALHGGLRGFDKRMWKDEPVDSDVPAVRLTRFSPDGEEGFPGNMYVTVTFSLNEDNELRIAYQATTDKTTVINLTNHSYINLSGQGSVVDDLLTIHADNYTLADQNHIPTGEIKPVAGTPFDFTQPTPIGTHLAEAGNKPVGFDNNFVLNKGFFSNFAVAAEVYDPKSGRTLSVSTDQPGVQLYTANHLDGSITGAGGIVYRQHDAFALETQHFPDSPNQPNFPSTVLAPGDTFKSTTVYAFGVK